MLSGRIKKKKNKSYYDIIEKWRTNKISGNASE